MEKREYTCKRCRVHGVVVPLRGHKQNCQWRHCQCPGCKQVVQYRDEHAKEINARRESGISAADVISIANLHRGTPAAAPTKPSSLSAKRQVKQAARGVRNKALYESLNQKMMDFAKNSPGLHPMAHVRKAIVESQAENPPAKKRTTTEYVYTDTCLYKGYNRPDEPVAGTSSASTPFPDVDSDSESPERGTVDRDVQALLQLEEAVEQLIAMFHVPSPAQRSTSPAATRTTPPRLAKLVNMFPMVNADVLRAIVQKSSDTPTATSRVLALFSPPGAPQTSGPRSTPRAEGPRKKRPRALQFSMDQKDLQEALPLGSTSTVEYTPGPRTPQKPLFRGLLNFNKSFESAEQAAAQAEDESGGGRYTITPAARKTPLKKRLTSCKICAAPVDKNDKNCSACGNQVSNRMYRY
ncbi:DMRT2 [Branchiostoma lanceolatum]|uniref:DMRT2 protein n=1 Tax=Branchiostoma lanceolatum TaxID=7740 RepID=A0A8K0A6I7_BRALA|nr:DMRT2 [Branchiostoma lanceolatum]